MNWTKKYFKGLSRLWESNLDFFHKYISPWPRDGQQEAVVCTWHSLSHRKPHDSLPSMLLRSPWSWYVAVHLLGRVACSYIDSSLSLLSPTTSASPSPTSIIHEHVYRLKADMIIRAPERKRNHLYICCNTDWDHLFFLTKRRAWKPLQKFYLYLQKGKKKRQQTEKERERNKNSNKAN